MIQALGEVTIGLHPRSDLRNALGLAKEPRPAPMCTVAVTTDRDVFPCPELGNTHAIALVLILTKKAHGAGVPLSWRLSVRAAVQQ